MNLVALYSLREKRLSINLPLLVGFLDMVAIEEIDLDVSLPMDGIGMVMMQPFVELTPEPFRWSEGKRDEQIRRLANTLQVAKKTDHGAEKTHFTIFPEYAIPGLEGVRNIEDILNDTSWPDRTVVIGGVDALRKLEYSALANEPYTHVHLDNSPESVQENRWVNCCITWLKCDGVLSRWLQLKLSPSWPEKNIQHQQMFCGQAIPLFSAKFENNAKCRFFSVVCFDWIGPIGTSHGIEAVLSSINNVWQTERKEINLLFVLQSNTEPNHYDFLGNTRTYFQARRHHPFVNRNEGVIVYANTAGGVRPGIYPSYGCTALISSPLAPYDTKGCPPTFASITRKLRKTDTLGRCKDALFREMGPCIHSIKFRLPPFINTGPSDRCLPIDYASVYPIDDERGEPRLPGRPVPGSVKWVNDHLDNTEPIVNSQPGHPLFAEIRNAHSQVSTEITKQSGDTLCKYLVMSSPHLEGDKEKCFQVGGCKIHNVDNFDETEIRSLRTVLYALIALYFWKTIKIAGSPAHGTVTSGDTVIDIVVVCGSTHDESFEYMKRTYQRSGQRLVIVVTTDIHDALWDDRFDSILERKERPPGGDTKITDPTSNLYRCGYQNLISTCLNSPNRADLGNEIKRIIGL